MQNPWYENFRAERLPNEVKKIIDNFRMLNSIRLQRT